MSSSAVVPIIAIANLLNGVIASALTLRLWLTYRRRRSSDDDFSEGVRYFVGLYLSLTVMWLLYATPGLLVTDLKWIALLQSTADVFVYVGAALGFQISFFALRRRTVGTIAAMLVTTAALMYVVSRSYFWAPHIQEVLPPYVYWRADIPAWLHTMTGVVALTSSATFVATFFFLGLQNRADPVVYRRSLYLMLGMAMTLSASLAFFILSTGGFWYAISASLLGICGLLLMLEGVTYGDRGERERLGS